MAPSCQGKLVRWLPPMQCPRCKSLRIQLGYKDKSLLVRLAGGDEFLCNNCGLEFKSFDSSGKVKRKPAAGRMNPSLTAAAPRDIRPATCFDSLAETVPQRAVVRSKVSRGVARRLASWEWRCLSQFTVSRQKTSNLAALIRNYHLPMGHRCRGYHRHARARRKEEGAASWFVRGAITQMSKGIAPDSRATLKNEEMKHRSSRRSEPP